MKATKDFVIVLNKDGHRTPYKEGDDKAGLKFVEVKKGGEIPTEFIKHYINHNIEMVEVEYKDNKPFIPPGLFDSPKVSTEMKIKKRKYSQDSLNEIYNKEGFSALRKIGKEFDPPVVDNSSRRIIVEILKRQEENQREGL